MDCFKLSGLTLALGWFSLFPGVAFAIPVTPRTQIQFSTSQQLIRILLGTFPRFRLSGTDLLVGGTQTLSGESFLSLHCGQNKNGQGFVDYGGSRITAEKLEVASASGFFKLNSKLYRDRLTILPRASGCAVVNTLGIEKYLAGLINREMSPSWPIEALKAQSVASRSYAIYQMHQSKVREYDLESTTQDQVYDGAESETPRSNEAVESTRGMVLTFSDNPIKAYFHANCGGITEVPEFVWGGEIAGFRPVVCPYHKTKRDQKRWSLSLTKPQIEHALRKIAGLLPRGFVRLAHLEAGAPNSSGRLSDVMLSDISGNSALVSANVFRNAMGNTRVKSTAFHIVEDAHGVELDGEGYGHGVGMCQVGARAMAEEGKRYQDILAYYYPLAKIRPL
jgi:stage II sporulation protein D